MRRRNAPVGKKWKEVEKRETTNEHEQTRIKIKGGGEGKVLKFWMEKIRMVKLL
jgi:hypothetical protein